MWRIVLCMSIAPFIMCGILNWFSPPSYPQLGLTHQIDLILDLILVCIWYNTLSIHFTIINSDILPWTVTFTIIDSDIYHRKQWHLSSSTVIFTIIDSDIYHHWQWYLPSLTVIFTIIDGDILPRTCSWCCSQSCCFRPWRYLPRT